MSTKTVGQETAERILDGITGDVRIGEKYYVFTVTYAYIGRVTKVTDWAIHLDGKDVMGVTSAGGDADAVTKIVQGKMKPEVHEFFGRPVIVTRQSITALISCV